MKSVEPAFFGPLLEWIGRHYYDQAAEYTRLRNLLTHFFHGRHCGADSEELVDRVLERCVKLLLRPPKQGKRLVSEVKPAAFAYRVAYYVLREYWKTAKTESIEGDLPDTIASSAKINPREDEVRHCRERAMAELPADRRTLLVRYYTVTPATKARLHAELAVEMNVEEGALRAQIFRIRRTLHKLVEKCLHDSSTQQKVHLRVNIREGHH